MSAVAPPVTSSTLARLCSRGRSQTVGAGQADPGRNTSCEPQKPLEARPRCLSRDAHKST